MLAESQNFRDGRKHAQVNAYCSRAHTNAQNGYNSQMDTLDQFKNTYTAVEDGYKENRRDSYSVGNK